MELPISSEPVPSEGPGLEEHAGPGGRAQWGAGLTGLSMVPPSVPGQVLPARRVGLCKLNVFRKDRGDRCRSKGTPRAVSVGECSRRAGREARGLPPVPTPTALVQTCCVRVVATLPSLALNSSAVSCLQATACSHCTRVHTRAHSPHTRRHAYIHVCTSPQHTCTHACTRACTHRLCTSLQEARWLIQRTSSLHRPEARVREAGAHWDLLGHSMSGYWEGAHLLPVPSWEAGCQLLGYFVPEAWSLAPGHSGLPTAEGRAVSASGHCRGMRNRMGSCGPSPVRGPGHHTVKVTEWQPQRPLEGRWGPHAWVACWASRRVWWGLMPCPWDGRGKQYRWGNRAWERSWGDSPQAGSWGPARWVWDLRVAHLVEKSWPFLFGEVARAPAGVSAAFVYILSPWQRLSVFMLLCVTF